MRCTMPISRSVGTAMNTSQSAVSIAAHTSGGNERRMLGGRPGNHGGCGERPGGCERRARSSLLRRAFRHASSVVAALAALAPRLVRLAHHDYPDGLLAQRDHHDTDHGAAPAGEATTLPTAVRAARARRLRGPDDGHGAR